MATPKLRFKEFGGDWELDLLGNLVQIKSGYSPSKYELDKSGEMPFLKVEELNNCDKYQEYSRFYTERNSDAAPSKSVVFPKRGAAILNNKVRILRVDALLDSNLMALIPQHSLDAEYLYYLINKIELYKIADTSTIPQINNKHIEPYSIYLPSTEEQIKIASFLSNVDEKISQLTQKHALLSQYKQGMMQKLFSQEIRFKADDGGEFGEWEERKLSEISEKAMYGMNAAATEYDGINKYLRITDICEFSNSFKKDNLTSPNAELFDRYKLQLGDLLFARTGASVGKSYLYREDDGITYFAGFLIKFSLNTNLVIPYFIFLQTLTKEFCQWVVTNSMRSGQPGINAEEYSSYIFKVPCLEEQTKIANFLSSIDQKIEVVAQQIEQAKTWKKGLLQQMFV